MGYDEGVYVGIFESREVHLVDTVLVGISLRFVEITNLRWTLTWYCLTFALFRAASPDLYEASLAKTCMSRPWACTEAAMFGIPKRLVSPARRHEHSSWH